MSSAEIPDDEVETESNLLCEAAQPYCDVFQGLEQLMKVVYHNKLKPGWKGVVKPARSVLIALKDKVKSQIDRMEANGVICKVTAPTGWDSNMVVVVKNNKVPICLDPADLNNSLLREHYPMVTLDDIVPILSRAKHFLTLPRDFGK